MTLNWGRWLPRILAAVLCGFTLIEVNYPHLSPQSQLAFFALLGLLLVFFKKPLHPRFENTGMDKTVTWVLVVATVLCFGFVFVQSEPIFKDWWLGGQPLGNRAGMETAWDHRVGLIGLILVLEAGRRTTGWTLPLLSLVFMGYTAWGSVLPDWLFPHRGYPWERIVSQAFLHSQGVFGIALNVMFTYVFLFVLFGALLERTGATGFIIAFARRLLGTSAGGPAKVAVLSSGMMGSLSGSAVANTATTGTFTIPMMRGSGFTATQAAAVEAAASSGGALAPPVMGAGAYMMLEMVDPPVTYLQIIKAALIPAICYYVALLWIVHFQAKKMGAGGEREREPLDWRKGAIFFGAFFALIVFLVVGFTAFRAVSLSLIAVFVLSLWNKDSRLGPGPILQAFEKTALSGAPLIAAASCVGIIIGIVTLTGIGSKLPGVLLPLAQHHLILALLLLMVATIILGMGLPSAVCYLLMATLVGPVLGEMGIVPLASHLFIFYFGMMSMVTPPVALAAYTSATIAGSDIMKTGFAAFRFSLIGFALPFAFVLKPELLLLAADGGPADFLAVILAVGLTLAAIIPLAAGIAGYGFTRLPIHSRSLLVAAAFVLLMVPTSTAYVWVHGLAVAGVAILGVHNWRQAKRQGAASPV